MENQGFLNAGSPFSDHVGITGDVASGRLCLEIKEHHLNSHGTAHGGAIFTLADRAFACVVNRKGQKAVAMEMKINFLSPVRLGDRLETAPRIIKEGKRTTVCLIEVKRGEEAMALITATAFNLNQSERKK